MCEPVYVGWRPSLGWQWVTQNANTWAIHGEGPFMRWFPSTGHVFVRMKIYGAVAVRELGEFGWRQGWWTDGSVYLLQDEDDPGYLPEP